MERKKSNDSDEENKEEEYDVVEDDLRDSQKYNKDLRYTEVTDSKYEEKKSGQTKANLVKFNFKIILLGNAAVGKTSIFNCFIFSKMNHKTESTIVPNIQTKILNIDENTIVSLQVCDTCGEELTKTVGKSYYKDAHGVVLVFDTTNESSFEVLDYWVDEVNNHASKDSIIIIGGNKADLRKERTIKYNDAFIYAKKLQVDYYDISAKTGNNVHLLFEVLTSRIQLKFEEGGFKKQKNQKGRITLSKQEHIQKDRQTIHNEKRCCK